MRRILLVISFMLVCLWGFSHRQARYDKILSDLHKSGIKTEASNDTVFTYKGYTVKMKTDGDSIYHIGLNLFNPEWGTMVDGRILDFIESALLYEIVLGNHSGNAEIDIIKGNLSDFKNLGPNSTCNITNSDLKELMVEWISEKGKETRISFPINYETILGGTRGEIEAEFISRLKKPVATERGVTIIEKVNLEPYGEEGYILPGPIYIDRQIARNVYLGSEDASDIIWDVSKPVESISNLFSYAPVKKDAGLDLTVFKHEYGEKEHLKTSIEHLLSIAEEEGCLPFWGLESFDGNSLTGSLFLYNPQQGYDHVVKIECNPKDVIEGKGEIIAKAYLYIPTNNVRALDEPYITKTEDEKIKYMDN